MSETVEQQQTADVSSPLHSNDFRAFLAHRKEHGNQLAAVADQQKTESAVTTDATQTNSGESEPDQPQQENETQAEQPKKPKTTPVGDRIKHYSDRAKAAEARVKELEAQLSGKPAEKQPAAKAEPVEAKAPAKPAAPKLKDFDTYDAFHEAQEKYLEDLAEYTEKLTDYKAQQQAAAYEQKQREAKQKTEADAIMSSFAEREAAARAKYDDYDEVAHADDLPITQAMSAAIVESELGHEIAYFLGSNRDEAERIAKLPAASQIREIGKIEARLTPDEKTPEPKKPAAVASKAPPPGKPVKGGTPAPVDPQKIIATSTNFREAYKAWEEKRKR